MPSPVLNLYPTDVTRYTRNPNGTFTSTVIGSSPALQLQSTYDDVVRRPYPKDPWASGTGWQRVELKKHMVSMGRRDISSTQWIEALPRYWWSGDLTNYTGYPSTSALVERLRKKIKDQNVNLGQSLAEYRQTANLFNRAAQDVVAGFRSLRSGRALQDIARYFTRPRNRIEKDVANRWLEYQYGLKPLISDLYGSVDELNKVLLEGKYLYANVRERSTLAGTSFWPPDVANHLIEGYGDYKVDFDIRLHARYRISSSAVKQLAQVGITNPLALAWEVVPYSFVFDWMFPVGNYLASLDALVGVSSFSYYTIRRSNGVQIGATNGGRWTYTRSSYLRSVSSSLPTPRLSYKPSKSLTAVLNGIALLTQLRR